MTPRAISSHAATTSSAACAKQADAERLKNEFPAHFTPLLFDVTDAAAITRAVEQVKQQIGNRGLAALVNNSGISGAAPLMHVPLDEVRRMFEVNVFGLLQVTQAFLPLLGATRNCPHAPGRVINISSISGGLVFPFVGAYGASKHAVEALTDGLRRELAIAGIQVIGIEPGVIRTPMWEKGSEADTRFAAHRLCTDDGKAARHHRRDGPQGRPGGNGQPRHPSRDRRAAPEDALSADFPVAPVARSRRPCARPPDPLGDGPLKPPTPGFHSLTGLQKFVDARWR